MIIIVRLLLAAMLLLVVSGSLPTLFGKFNGKFNIDVVKSGALSFAPWVKLHHIVLLKDIDDSHNGAYTIDYSPLDQKKPGTLLQLFFGLSVPAEIRIRFLNSSSISLQEIKDNCESSDIVILDKKRIEITPYRGILRISNGRMPSFSPAMEQLVADVTANWRSRMNLYTHNCQHFSGFIRRLVKRC